MKLVQGASLDNALAGRTSLEARLDLLPHIIAAVDALAYAHSVKIIHRDLKPANVLVGEFGETVVIDWGLAKDLGDADEAGAPRVGPYRSVVGSSGADATQQGAVIGTPAYMPPEQALGEPVDARADVYALGALLYQILAGAPPYVGRTGAAILDAVVAGPPPALAERAPGVPLDLVAIVDKAMSRDATQRYPTAKELATDLKKFQTGQLVAAHRYTPWQLVRRWVARHRLTVAVAAIAVAMLVTGGVVSVHRILSEQARTSAQRQLAEQSRSDAEELLSFMLGSLRKKLQPLGKLDLLDDVAKKAVAFYDRRVDQLGDPELARLTWARRNLGDVLRQQRDGDLAGALRQYRASLQLAEQLAARSPNDPARARDLADSHDRIGEVALAQGKAEEALASFHTAQSIRERLAAAAPTDISSQRDLAESHDKIARMLVKRGDVSKALADFRASLAILEPLRVRDPSDDEVQHAVEVEHQQIGNVLFAQRAIGDALVEYRAELAIAEALAAKNPADADRKEHLSVAHNKLGNVLFAQNDYAGALREYRADEAIAEVLAAADPTNGDRQANVAVSKNKMGNALAAVNDTAGAIGSYRESLAITAALAAKDPSNVDRQRAVAVARNKIGDVRAGTGDPSGALTDYRAAQSILEALAAANRSDLELQIDGAVSHERIGDALVGAHDKAAAGAEYGEGLAQAQALLAAHPESADARQLIDEFTGKIAACCHARAGTPK